MRTKPSAPSESTRDAQFRERTAHRFGELIRVGRRIWGPSGDGMTQKQFAEKLGVSRRTVACMESGDPSVALETWIRAWQVLGMLPRIVASVSPSPEMAAYSAAAVAAARQAKGRDADAAAMHFPAPKRRDRPSL